MALKQLVNWLSQQRVDIPDLRAIESGVIFDLKTLIQCFVGDTPYILRGFTIPVTGVSGPATSLQMVVDSSVVWLPDDVNGSFLRVPSGTANEILSPANPNVVGSFSPGANFISIQFNRATDPSTNDLVSIWDVDSQTEFDETAPRGLVMNYQIVINGSTFGNNAPVAIVNVSGSNVTSIKNCKQGLFRLGRGGANPNINYSHTYMVNPENNLTATSNSSPDPFTGGDWELNSWKDFADAVMTEFKNLKNSAFWYGTNSVIPGLNVTDLYFDAIGSKITGSGAWVHSPSTPGQLTWTSTLNIRSIFGYMTLLVPTGNVTLNDQDVAYLALQRNIDFQPSNTFTFINGSTSVTATLAVAGISPGDYIKYEADNMTAWTKVQTIIGTSITLASAYPGSSATGKALQTVGSYTMQTASPNNVPNNSSTYWIAKRDDNAFASFSIAGPGSNGLERASDITTLISATPHGLVLGQSFAVSGASDSSFNGKFDVGTVNSSTSISYLNPGTNFGPGSAGNGTVSAVPRIYLRGGGSGELEQGESIQIDDQTTLNIQAFVGMEDETDVTPPYTQFPNGLSPFSFSSMNNLTQAISAITGNVNGLYDALAQPAYDEPLVVVSGSPASSNEVTGPITSGAMLTLPLHSRKSETVQNYVVGQGYLEVWLNGQKLTLNTYGTGSVGSFAANGLSGPYSSDYAFNGSLIGGAGVTVTPSVPQNMVQFQVVLSRSIATAAGNLVARIRTDAGGVPSGTILATSTNMVSVASLPTVGTTISNFTFNPTALSSATPYWFTIETDATYQSSSSSYVIWYRPTGGGTPYASATYNGTSWTPQINLTPSFEADSSTLSVIGGGWTEVGAALSNSNVIIINQNLVVDDIVSFRIGGIGGPGASAGAPDDNFHTLPFSTSVNPSTEILIWDADVSSYRKETRANFLAGVTNLLNVNTYASNHTASVATDDVMLMNAGGGALILSLPTAASAVGKRFEIKKIDATGNSVTIQAHGAETIDGANTITLTVQYQSRSIVSDGVSWWII